MNPLLLQCFNRRKRNKTACKQRHEAARTTVCSMNRQSLLSLPGTDTFPHRVTLDVEETLTADLVPMRRNLSALDGRTLRPRYALANAGVVFVSQVGKSQ